MRRPDHQLARPTITTVMHFVDDPGTAAQWWAEQLGGSVQMDQGFAWFALDGTEVGFHPADATKNPPGASTVVYRRCDDLDVTRQWFLDNGCVPWRGPLELEDGRRICQLKDPFGIVFGLESDRADSGEVPTVVLTGTIGAGKTTVAEEVSDVLNEHGARHALLDLDWLAQVYPSPDHDRFNNGLVFDNLAAIWPNLRRAGARHLVMARVIEDPADLERYRQAIPESRLTVVRVTAPREVRRERITQREVGGMRAWYLARTDELEAVINRVGVEDFCVANDGRPIRDVALDVLSQLGWLRA